MAYYFWSVFLLCILARPSISEVSLDGNITEQVIQNGVVDLAIKLNKLLPQNNSENIVFSPFNIYNALALVHLGGDGITRDEITNVMGIPKDLEVSQIHETIKTLLTSVQEYREIRTFQEGKVQKVKVTNINLANGIFVQNGVTLKESYKTNLSNYYNSEIFGVDFVNQGSEATRIINEYIANKTENHIPQLYPEPLSTDVRIILASSLYFKSVWDTKFEKTQTHEDTFYSENGNINVSMMHKITEMPYADLPSLNAEACKLWFADNSVSMYIILPYENHTLNNLITNISGQDINNIINKTSTNFFVDLKLPKTTFKWSKTLNNELIELGAKSMFTNQANLKNMIDENNLVVSEVDHAAEIKITEDGTEASAVTAIKIGLRSAAHSKKAAFYVNRPFLMFIYHHGINSILFFGSVRNPNGN